jgi:hypothetical protein
MTGTHKYDDADYHYGDDVFSEKNLPLENGGTHIGFFLSWVVLNGMESEFLREGASDAIEKVKRREITGRDLLFHYCDEKLTSADLNNQVNSFAQVYYDRYLQDYEATFGSIVESTYEIEDTWTNYETIAAVIDRRYAEYQSGALSPPPRSQPWWKFWGR